MTKKCIVTNKESKCKYALNFRLNITPMEVNVFEYGTEDFVYSSNAQENEMIDDFIKRVKKEVQTHEDL